MTGSLKLSLKGDVTDFGVLENFIKEKARECVHRASGQLQRDFVTPTYGITSGSDDKADVAERSTVGHYLQMYDWDSCFFAQAAHRIGEPDLPASVLFNFLALAQADGYIPRTVSPARIWDDGDLCKPFLCQLALLVYRQNKESKPKVISELSASLDALACYLRYFKSHRRHKSGLYHWRNVLESGVDNNLALLGPMEAAKGANESISDFPDGKLLAVDINSYLVAEFDAFSELAEALGKDSLASEFAAESKSLRALIEKHLWDEESGFYYNAYPDKMELLKVKAWTGFTPLVCKVSSEARAKIVIERNMLADSEFLSPFGLVSLANSELLQNQAPRGLYGRVIVCNWQGPVWILPNVLGCRALVDAGRREEARQVARRALSAMALDLSEAEMLHENYDCRTGKGLWAPHFMSWNVLALELIDLVKGK